MRRAPQREARSRAAITRAHLLVERYLVAAAAYRKLVSDSAKRICRTVHDIITRKSQHNAHHQINTKCSSFSEHLKS
eukprot:1491820-Rhodomonas_salina.1